MKNVVIVGGGGFGREVACWLTDMLDHDETRIAGFLDDNFAVGELVRPGYQYPVLGTIGGYQPQTNDLFVMAIGNPAVKLRMAQALVNRGAQFLNLIHPTAVIASTATLGQGVILCPFSLVSADVLIGDFVTLNAYTSIGHDAVIGNGATLSSHVDITGYAVLEESVFVGSSAVVLPKVKVGKGAIIGAGSIVARRVLEGTTVYTMPAKKL